MGDGGVFAGDTGVVIWSFDAPSDFGWTIYKVPTLLFFISPLTLRFLFYPPPSIFVFCRFCCLLSFLFFFLSFLLCFSFAFHCFHLHLFCCLVLVSLHLSLLSSLFRPFCPLLFITLFLISSSSLFCIILKFILQISSLLLFVLCPVPSFSVSFFFSLFIFIFFPLDKKATQTRK